MACESTGMNEKRVNQFNKIRLLNDIANQIGFYGVQNGYETLMDKIDMNCGAVPEGDFGQVIDLNAAHEFLSLYMQIAENRFAMAVTELLRMNAAFIEPLKEFCGRVGRDMQVTGIETVQQAYEVYEGFVLDGMPCDETKDILESGENRIVWKKTVDTHKKAWEKAEGDENNYYLLLSLFVNGLLTHSKFRFKIEGQELFTIESE